MPKIKCPHCGASNQDVSDQDPCWQCGGLLGAGPVATAPEGAAGGQKQMEREAPVPLRFSEAGKTGKPALAALAMIIVLLLAIVFLAVFLFLRHH